MEPHGGFSSKELFGYQRLRDNLGVKHTTSGIKTICLGSQKPSCACYFAVVTRGTHPVRVPRLWIHQAAGERLVVVNPRWQSESTDGPKGGWNVELSLSLSIYPSIHLSILLFCLLIYLSINLSFHPSA